MSKSNSLSIVLLWISKFQLKNETRLPFCSCKSWRKLAFRSAWFFRSTPVNNIIIRSRLAIHHSKRSFSDGNICVVSEQRWSESNFHISWIRELHFTIDHGQFKRESKDNRNEVCNGCGVIRIAPRLQRLKRRFQLRFFDMMLLFRSRAEA